MKKFKGQLLTGVIFVVSSAVLYGIHYLLFHNHHYVVQEHFLGDLAFIPIEVLVVTLIIHKILDEREKHTMLKKLNMIFGVFFSEVGYTLLRELACADPDIKAIRQNLIIPTQCDHGHFRSLKANMKGYRYHISGERINLETIKNALHAKREFLMKLLENPMLLEHEHFTELLRAAFHLEEEFTMRLDIAQLSEGDNAHIIDDIMRIYRLLFGEWLRYMEYLHQEYPYLFAFAIATNPFRQP